MLKGNDIIGKPIVAHDTGEEIHRVKDLIFDHSGRLLGFLVNENLLFRDAKVLPLHSVKVIGPDVIIASSETAIASGSRLPEIKQALDRDIIMVGTKIVTEEGYDLGTITDLYFDKQTGAIEGYEVIGGLFAAPESKLAFVPAPQDLKIGDDVAFVPRDIAEMMEERVKPVTEETLAAAAYSNNSELLASPAIATSTSNGQAISSTGTMVVTPEQQISTNQVYPATNNLSGNSPQQDNSLLNHQPNRLKEANRIQNLLSADSIEQTLGYRVHRSVKVPEGIYIAALGQIVTEKVIARAKLYQKEIDLIAAVYPDESRKIELLSLRDSLSLPTKKRSYNLNHWVKNRVNKLQFENLKSRESKQIKQAIGRPVNRVILDTNDRIILNAGELITYKAIEQAREARVLDILLNSVSQAQPGKL